MLSCSPSSVFLSHGLAVIGLSFTCPLPRRRFLVVPILPNMLRPPALVYLAYVSALFCFAHFPRCVFYVGFSAVRLVRLRRPSACSCVFRFVGVALFRRRCSLDSSSVVGLVPRYRVPSVSCLIRR